jgi:alpha-galactosidase
MPIHASDWGWVLETRSTSYALGLNQAGLLAHRYWGQRLPRLGDFPPAPDPWQLGALNDPPNQLTPEEYPAYGGVNYVEPCLKVTFADGVRDLVLRFDSAEVNHAADELLIHLRDAGYPLRVTLRYRVRAEYDLIERAASVTNDGDSPVTIERVWSAQWHLPQAEQFRLTHLTGRWLDEFHLVREPLVPGNKILESRRIITGHQHQPWFAVDRGTASEDAGDVWFGVLAWSGNWKLSAEVTEFASTRVSLGINDWDFAWRLGPGASFDAPPSYAGYTGAGFGGMSRRLHDFVRDTLLPHGRAIHKVLYNSWEATTFDVAVESQAALAELAAEMGVELFVMDDGWFHGRHDENAGLGDWWPDVGKFPSGLDPLIERVNALGMEFGLWVEPEMVNPDSELYRAHPDWVIHFPTRQRTESRNQLILNIARADVQAYLIEALDRLLSENKIAFIKWDFNRYVSEPGWPDAPGDPRELWVRFVQGLYRIWGALRQRHPHVIWQSCASGGGRADYAMLRLADQIWTSDNTDATSRLGIQEGFSQLFPANTMEAWVTDSALEGRPVELAFRFHVSMCGSLGVGGHLLHWTPEERAEARRWVALYKEIREVVQFGDQYRLRSPQSHAFSAVQYMAKDGAEGVLFAFRTHLVPPATLPPLYLRGLDAEALYAVEGIDGARSGAAWMHAGLRLELKDFESTVRRIRRI